MLQALLQVLDEPVPGRLQRLAINLIAINCMMFARQGGFHGLTWGLAIPINLVSGFGIFAQQPAVLTDGYYQSVPEQQDIHELP